MIKDKNQPIHHNLTIRQYYAGLAMQGFISNPQCTEFVTSARLIAIHSVKLANGLIEALNEGEMELKTDDFM